MTRRGNDGVDNVRCPNGGKVAYMTREHAKAALRDMRAKHVAHGQKLDPRMHTYLCPYCAMWHVGTDLRKTL